MAKHEARCKELQNLSVKNILWLAILVFIYAYITVQLTRKLGMLADSMINILPALEYLQVKSKESTTYILLLSLTMRENNHLTECKSSSHCLLTENRALFGGDYTQFDAIIFDEHYLRKKWIERRSNSQLYVFTTIESPVNYPACELRNDDFFNWTFTYRLDSDIFWKFFVVRNISGDIVAPSENVKWDLNKHPIRTNIKSILHGKKKALAWIVSNCNGILRNSYLTKLQEYLFYYSLKIDIYGRCTKRKCDGNCEEMLRNNYYFYVAFENSLSLDYVTEKVLHGYDNYVVPIVYGGANYSRFLPPGSYIDARKIHPYNLAHLIHLATTDPKVYESYFHWTSLYTISSNDPSINPTCELCEALRSSKAKNAPAKKKFRFWWNTLNGMKLCLPEDLLSFQDLINDF